jgi:hypothetical protein
VPAEATGLLTAEPLVLTPHQSTGRLRISTTADPRLLGPWQLRLAASTLLNDRWPVVSEALLDLDLTPSEQKTGDGTR